ncbi:MAG: pentapeptide repeat-containing protein [Oculatellaceae cyanobacterium bins.114]|nr:pentapeptide repeat-containing protein [Oculatellaceae cyanobacterium bins.114]
MAWLIMRRVKFRNNSGMRLLKVCFTAGMVTGLVLGTLRMEAAVMGKPWITLQDRLTSLKESEILGAVESISIITAMVLFIQEGHQEERKRAQYAAWALIDLADGKETSYARIQALEDLNREGVSLSRLDAPEADLIQIQLPGANLQEAKLIGTLLKEANLQEARLDFANLQGADLQQAILKDGGFLDANLMGARLGGADLTGADLCNANLQGANFLAANLLNADLSRADVRGASFRKAQNLEVEQIKSAKNWELGEYDDDFRVKLGLPV